MCISYLTPKVPRPSRGHTCGGRFWKSHSSTGGSLSLTFFLHLFCKAEPQNSRERRTDLCRATFQPRLGTSWRLGRVCRRLVLSGPLPWLASLEYPFLISFSFLSLTLSSPCPSPAASYRAIPSLPLAQDQIRGKEQQREPIIKPKVASGAGGGGDRPPTFPPPPLQHLRPARVAEEPAPTPPKSPPPAAQGLAADPGARGSRVQSRNDQPASDLCPQILNQNPRSL